MHWHSFSRVFLFRPLPTMAALCSLRIVCAARAPKVTGHLSLHSFSFTPETETRTLEPCTLYPIPNPKPFTPSPFAINIKVAAVAEDKAAPVLKSGQKYKNLGSAVDAGLIQVNPGADRATNPITYTVTVYSCLDPSHL